MAQRSSVLVCLSMLLIFSCTSFGQSLYDLDSIQQVVIKTENKDWQNELISFKQQESEKTIPATLALNGKELGAIGLRHKGNSSFYYRNNREQKKLPFHIDIANKGSRKLIGVKTIVLNNIFRDPSHIREVLAYDLVRRYMPAALANVASVTIDDTFYGVYHNVEFIDTRFLNKHFGTSKGVLFKCDPNYKRIKNKRCPYDPLADLAYRGPDSLCYYSSYEKRSEDGWLELIKLTKILDKDPEKFAEVADVEQFLTFIALNNIIVNLDSYMGKLCHNYYIYQDSLGIFNPIIWDLNLAFGGFNVIGKKGLSREQLITLSPFVHDKSQKFPLISQLLSVKSFRQRYVEIYKGILSDYFISGQYALVAKRLQRTIASSIKSEYPSKIWPDNLINTSIADDKEIIGVTELMEARVSYLQAYFDL